MITSNCDDYYGIPGIDWSSVPCLLWPGSMRGELYFEQTITCPYVCRNSSPYTVVVLIPSRNSAPSRGRDELVTQVVAKYSIDKAQGWFVLPIVVPAGLALLLGAIMLYRQFIGV
jgi:hypothetical protein